MIDVVANEKGKNEFYVPVSWTMCSKVRVQANSAEEAYKYVEAHKDDIPIDEDEAWYLTDSYQIDNGYEGCLEESAANLDHEWGFLCEKFECQKNLSVYTDSMLFDNFMSDKSLEDDESYIAGATFTNGLPKDDLNVRLVVAGEVRVIYKDIVYTRPSDFPDELKKLIKENPNNWQTDEDVAVDMQNWFEVVLVEDNDAWVFEDNVSKKTPEEILEVMQAAAKQHFEDAAGAVKTNIGYMPKGDYLDIMARQNGFDDYDDMTKAGYHVNEEDKGSR